MHSANECEHTREVLVKKAQWQKCHRDQSGLTNVISRHSVVTREKMKSLKAFESEMIPKP